MFFARNGAKRTKVHAPKQMKAVQLISHGAPGVMELRDVPDPSAGPDDAVIRVRACGLNRLDLWTEQGELPVPITLPKTLGGEISGEVLKLGANVKNWHIGQRVAVQSNIFCGKCEFCLQGEESICINGQLLGVQRDGGFAEQILVPASALVHLPDAVSFENSAALTLAASTAMHMLTRRTHVCQGHWVLVIAGASGVGSAAIQIAKQLGAYVIATGSTQEKRDFSKKLGADYTVDITLNDWPAEVRKITQKRGVDVVVEHVGGDILLGCFNCLARGGTIVTCGATAGREVNFKLWSFFVKEQKLIGSYGRTRADIKDTLDWAAKGRLKPAIDRTYPLGDTVKAFGDLRARRVRGKVVIISQ
jgi:NADPH:quinone reductase-like Zn-dependent oxidoreductase